MNTNILANLCGWCAYIHKGQAAFVVISTGHAQGLTRTAEPSYAAAVAAGGAGKAVPNRCPAAAEGAAAAAAEAAAAAAAAAAEAAAGAAARAAAGAAQQRLTERP